MTIEWDGDENKNKIELTMSKATDTYNVNQIILTLEGALLPLSFTIIITV